MRRYFIVGSRIDELLRLACLPFLPTKLARLRCVLVAHRVELIRYGQIKALPRELRVRAWTLSNNRTFSIAITAWSAKVVTSSICLLVNGRTEFRPKAMTPIGDPSRRSGTPRSVRKPPLRPAPPMRVFRIGQSVEDMRLPSPDF